MTLDEIKVLDIEAVEARMSDIAKEIESADSNEAMDALQAEFEAIEARKSEIAQEIEQRKADMANVVKGLKANVVEKFDERGNGKMEIEFRNTAEYIDAYAEYIKTGDATEVRALTSTNDTTPNGTGTVAVPDFVYDVVKTAWAKEGIMALVRKSYLKGNLKVGFEISGTDAVVHTEGAAAVSEETLVLGTVTLTPVSIKKWISVSDEVYDLRGEAFLSYIYDELAYRIAKKAADQLVAKIEACGTTSTTTCPGVPKLPVTTASVGDVAQALALLSDEAANPVIIMNKATWGSYKAAQYANKFNVDPFEGLPVVFNNKITAYSAATSGVTFAIVGDLGHGALANFPNGDGIDFKFDDTTLMTQDLIRVLGREYVGLGVVAPDAFVKICKPAA